jgi:hypothetical protein
MFHKNPRNVYPVNLCIQKDGREEFKYPVWRRVKIPPPQSLRVVRGDEEGTQSQMRRLCMVIGPQWPDQSAIAL